ncbi:hypothetical protein CC80DRAFT_382247, partial [Byssothecium circinans]
MSRYERYKKCTDEAITRLMDIGKAYGNDVPCVQVFESTSPPPLTEPGKLKGRARTLARPPISNATPPAQSRYKVSTQEILRQAQNLKECGERKHTIIMARHVFRAFKQAIKDRKQHEEEYEEKTWGDSTGGHRYFIQILVTVRAMLFSCVKVQRRT